MGKILEKDKVYLLGLKPDDITFDLLLDLFAHTVKVEKGKQILSKGRINLTDEFELKPKEYFNKTQVRTTAGQFIYNKLIIERELSDVVGYVNIPINNTQLKKIEEILSKALLNDIITIDDMVKYLNRTQWLSMQFHSVVSGSFTMNTLKPSNNVTKMRNRLFKENADKLNTGDVITAVNIEQQLLKVAQEELKNDSGMNLYKSGARGSFGNNFKNISVMKGPVFNPSTGKYEIVKSNFMEGIDKKDLASYGNAIISGAYPKAIGTAVGGYFAKQMVAILQAVVLDKPGSDCGSKGYLKIFLDKKIANKFLYRYIIDRNKLVLLDNSNISKYVDTEIKLRSPKFCISDKLCRVCAGTMYDKLKINNIGLTSAKVSTTMVNLSMKKFHDGTLKVNVIDINSMVF